MAGKKKGKTQTFGKQEEEVETKYMIVKEEDGNRVFAGQWESLIPNKDEAERLAASMLTPCYAKAVKKEEL